MHDSKYHIETQYIVKLIFRKRVLFLLGLSKLKSLTLVTTAEGAGHSRVLGPGRAARVQVCDPARRGRDGRVGRRRAGGRQEGLERPGQGQACLLQGYTTRSACGLQVLLTRVVKTTPDHHFQGHHIPQTPPAAEGLAEPGLL